MHAEIDQSGKFEQTNTHTVIAISNKTKMTLFISFSEKIKIIKTLRRSVVRRKDINAKFHLKHLPIIHFKLIGKSSHAHELAHKAYRKKDKKNSVVVMAKEVIECLGL